MNSLINLIEAVKNHPKLFQNSLPNEDQDNLKEWSAVAEKCNLTRSEAQDQWNILLLEYVEYLRSNKSFPLATHMDFLQPHFFTVIDNVNIDEEELLSILDSNKPEETETPKVETKKAMEEPANVKIENNCKTFEIEKKCISTTTEQPKADSLTLPNEGNKSNHILSQHDSSAFSNLTSLELIFLGYAKQLQKMPLHLQLKVKRKIADVMDDAELTMMNN